MMIMPGARMRKIATALAVLLLGETLPQSALADSNCAPAATANDDVLLTMVSFSVALLSENMRFLQQLTSPDFQALDSGEPLTGAAALKELSGMARATGPRFNWNLSKAKTNVDCATAVVDYVDESTFGGGSGAQLPTGLAVAALQYANLRWQIVFVVTTRAVTAPQ
jgi:hypothetical protein